MTSDTRFGVGAGPASITHAEPARPIPAVPGAGALRQTGSAPRSVRAAGKGFEQLVGETLVRTLWDHALLVKGGENASRDSFEHLHHAAVVREIERVPADAFAFIEGFIASGGGTFELDLEIGNFG